MAIIYVDSTAVGANDGTSWTDARTTLAAAHNAWTVGDIIYLEKDSTEVDASPGDPASDTSTQHVPVLRVDKATGDYAPATLDGLATNNITAGFNMNINRQYGVFQGLAIQVQRSLTLDSSGDVDFSDCYLETGAGGSGVDGSWNATGSYAAPLTFTNCYLKMGGAATKFNTLWLHLKHCTVETVHATDIDAEALIRLTPSFKSTLLFEDCDLTALNIDPLVNVGDLGTNNNTQATIRFIRCKLKATYAKTVGSFASRGKVELIGCSTDGASYINERVEHHGEINTSTTAYRDGGYADADGDTPLSEELVPNASCVLSRPLESFPIAVTVAEAGSVTFTLELIENYTTPLTASQIWLELSYPGAASATANGIDISTREVVKLTPTALSAGVGLTGWTGEPAGSRSVKLEATVSVGRPGVVVGVVKLTEYEAGKVVHIDPKFTVA